MSYLPQHDALYAVSDLHLGGKTGFQIFNQGKLLGKLIDHLRDKEPGRRVALVLNGDIVDFLAEDEAKYLDREGALEKLARIWRDEEFAPVWAALQGFVQTEHRTLVLILGNHDLELALPPVHAWLLDQLSQGSAAARGRIVTTFDGTGYACQVGVKRVLCVHGNEVDPWNVVDHEALRRVAEAMRRDGTPEEWEPNAGTRLVVDVMNDIKKRRPFVDLLKPEVKGVLNMLPWIDPLCRKKLTTLAPILLRRVQGGRAARRLLGETVNEDDTLPTAEAAMAWAFGPSPEATGQDLLEQAERAFQAGLDPVQQYRVHEADGTLGHPQRLWDWLQQKSPAESMRMALIDWLKEDRSFDVRFCDPDSDALIDRSVGRNIDYLLAGHTHLARALPRQLGGYYYNSGTWVRLIELSHDVLTSQERFEGLYEALTTQSMDVLDQKEIAKPRPTVVCIEAFDGQARGRLAEATDANGGFDLSLLRDDRQIEAAADPAAR